MIRDGGTRVRVPGQTSHVHSSVQGTDPWEGPSFVVPCFRYRTVAGPGWRDSIYCRLPRDTEGPVTEEIVYFPRPGS